MQIILHNDDTIHGFESAQAFAEDVIGKALHGMADRLTRVEIWVSDENGPKGGPENKKCSIEAHPSGRKPVGVHAHGPDVPSVMRTAAKKLARVLDKEFRPSH